MIFLFIQHCFVSFNTIFETFKYIDKTTYDDVKTYLKNLLAISKSNYNAESYGEAMSLQLTARS